MAEKSKSTLAADLAASLADNTSGAITPAVLRSFVTDVVDSVTATGKATGAGTDYTLTGTSALVDFGTTDPALALPGAGTFLVVAAVQVVADAGGSGDDVRLKLRNSTDGSDVGFERRVTMPANSAQVPVVLVEIVTVAAAKTLQLWGYNATSARGVITSSKTEVTRIRLA